MKNHFIQHHHLVNEARFAAIKLALWAITVTATLLFLFSCAGAGRSIASSGLGKATDPIPFMEAARTGVLPSGLRYYLLENTQPEGRAYLTLAVDAGSVLETEDERGLAHFVEHMAFLRTARFGKLELLDYLRSLGMRFGPEVNASTSFNETVYGIEVPVETGLDSRKRVPDMALAVIDDWSRNIIFNSEDVDGERLVVLEEYRYRALNANGRIQMEMLPLLFRGSIYADRLTIGLPAVIESAPAERIEGFYKKWYRPENMAIIIVGDFDAAYLEATLTEHFPSDKAAYPALSGGAGMFSRPRPTLSAPKKGSFESLVLTDSELTFSAIELYWKRKAEPVRGNLAYYRTYIIDTLADIMLSLRFDEASTKPETPYIAANVGRASLDNSTRFYYLSAVAKTGLTRESLRELFLVRETLSRYGFTGDEAETAKTFLLSNLEQMAAENQHSSNFVNAFTEHFLSGEPAPDPEWQLDAARKLLPGITLKEINKAVKDYFADDDITVIIGAPDAEAASLPGKAEIKAMSDEMRKMKIAAPVSASRSDALLSFVPAPGSIVSETIDSETGATIIMLSNGAELILKDTRNRNSEVSLYAQARGGHLSVSPESVVSARLAADMLSASGLGPHTRAELAKLLMDKQASLSFWTQDYLRGFTGAAAVKNLQTLFELLYLSFTQPRMDVDAVQALLDQYGSGLVFKENDPNAVMEREIFRTIYGNPLLHPLEAADIDKVDLNDVVTFVAACLNPADYVFVIAGNIDLLLLRSLAETYLASIPQGDAFNQWADIDPMRPQDTTREIRKGLEERSTVYMGWFTPQPYSEEKNAAVSVLTEYLDIQLIDEIREKLNGVYAVAPRILVSPIPRGELTGEAIFFCDPGRVPELTAAVKEEFLKVARGEIKTDVLTKAIEATIQSHEGSIQQNSYIANSYADSVVIFRAPLSRLDSRPALYRAVSPADLQRTVAEFVGGSFVQFSLYPEN
jgi:zinc protease